VYNDKPYLSTRGAAWGEDGYARVVTSRYMNGRGRRYNLLLEDYCLWAEPEGWKQATELPLPHYDL
jgi:hypothetical protein